MGVAIERLTKFLPNLSLGLAVGTTPEINMLGFAGGSVRIPAGSPITLLTFLGAMVPANDPLGAQTYGALHTSDSLDTAITLVVSAGNVYQLPTAIFALGALKITVNAAGLVDVCLKG